MIDLCRLLGHDYGPERVVELHDPPKATVKRLCYRCGHEKRYTIDRVVSMRFSDFALGAHKDTGEGMIMIDGEWQPFKEWARREFAEASDG